MDIPSNTLFRFFCCVSSAVIFLTSPLSHALALDTELHECPAFPRADFIDECFSDWEVFLENQGFTSRLVSCVDDPVASEGELLTAMQFATPLPDSFLFAVHASNTPLNPFLASLFTAVPYVRWPLLLSDGSVCNAFLSTIEDEKGWYDACRWEILQSKSWRKFVRQIWTGSINKLHVRGGS